MLPEFMINVTLYNYIKTSGSFSSNNLKALRSPTNWKNIPACFNSPWFRKGDEGEAGQWVEFCSRGGIIDYDTISRKGEMLYVMETYYDLPYL